MPPGPVKKSHKKMAAVHGRIDFMFLCTASYPAARSATINPRQTPPRQTSPRQTPLPWRRPLQQTVRILLECILVSFLLKKRNLWTNPSHLKQDPSTNKKTVQSNANRPLSGSPHWQIQNHGTFRGDGGGAGSANLLFIITENYMKIEIFGP